MQGNLRICPPFCLSYTITSFSVEKNNSLRHIQQCISFNGTAKKIGHTENDHITVIMAKTDKIYCSNSILGLGSLSMRFQVMILRDRNFFWLLRHPQSNNSNNLCLINLLHSVFRDSQQMVNIDKH